MSCHSLRRCPTIRCCEERKPCDCTRWVTVNKGSDDAPQLRARWVSQEFRGRYGDKHEYFTETPDLASVKAVIAHAARRAESEDIVVAVSDVRRAYFHAEEERDTFVELPDYVPAEFRTMHVGKLRKALCGTRPAAASWRDELTKGLVSCSLTVGTASRCCFHNELCSVAGTVHGDDIFVAGPRREVAKIGATLKKRWETRDQMIGPKPDDQKELRILRWCKRWVGLCCGFETWQRGCRRVWTEQVEASLFHGHGRLRCSMPR